ncbi:MAG: RNA polymerase sigma factor [Myxococcota bacterium]
MSLALDSEVPAFRKIFDEHAPVVRRYLTVRMKNAALADEATQETFVRAMTRLPTLRDPRRLRPWLLGIARRVSSEHRRSEERRLRLVVPADQVEVEAAATAETPETRLLEDEHVRHLESAVSTLREGRRRALSLRVDGDLGYPEIAAELGWSVPKVKNEIHRARLELRAVLAMSLGVLAFIFAFANPGVSASRHGAGELGLCYESGVGEAAALESEHRACLLASPAPSVFASESAMEALSAPLAPGHLDICGAIDICD